jgi:putative molybdopterin biosynthesis protein
VGLGLRPCARVYDLEFIPLFEEPYDLVFSQETLADSRLSPFFNHLASGDFRQAVEKIGGYLVTSDFGQVELVS